MPERRVYTGGTEGVERPTPQEHEQPKQLFRIFVRSRPIQAAAHEVTHLHQVERAGESEWTPWIALAGLVLFFAAVGLVMFGIVEAAYQLLANASPGG
jgi:hypothetical protein